ncbi:MAG: exo-alpha-sialidase [Gammaproteobacteria bacterium]|nr:exo-alpha-sialidase [Gammaproteobacteria bacterium]HRX69558.1 sialidase family protein [Candidatus Competibacteraceae bacterium]
MKLFTLFFTFLMMISGDIHAEIMNDPKALNQHPLGSNASWEYALDSQSELWLAYYGDDKLLYVRRPDGSEVNFSSQNRDQYLSGLAIDSGKDTLSIVWRDKLPEKDLRLLPGLPTTGPIPQSLSVGGSESEPLPRLKIAQRGDYYYLLWLGEKPDLETKQTYHQYFRYSEDGGKTFSEVERVIPGIYPMWIVDDQSIAIFSWIRSKERQVIAMRRFDRAAKHFGALVEIAETPEQISPIYRAFESAGRWFVTWLSQYGDGRDFLLEGAYSEDQGQTWKRFAFETIKGLDLSHLVAAADGKGHIALAFSGSHRLRDNNPQAKNDVYLTYSTDNGSTWSEPRSLRTDEQKITHAKFPAITFGSEPGVLLIAWEDWRDIRPNVYIAYSKDYGATWESTIPLGLPGRVNLGMEFDMEHELRNHNGNYHLVVKRFENDNLNQAELVHYTFTLDDLKQLPLLPRGIQLEKARLNDDRLRQRVKFYWDAMQRKDYAASYALLDPFFQAKVGRKAYWQKMGTIKYHGFRIEKTERIGKIAKVKITIEASVPEFRTASGKEYSKPKQEYTFIETWLFIGGDWYREYYEENSGVRYTGY